MAEPSATYMDRIAEAVYGELHDGRPLPDGQRGLYLGYAVLVLVAGDAVDVLDPSGAVVARGLVNFDADELPVLLGRSTGDLKAALGAPYEREVIHRDDLVLL